MAEDKFCIDCGQPCAPRASRCRDCYDVFHAVETVYTCPDCGGVRSRKATVCRACSYARRGVQSRGLAEPCPECGGKKSKGAQRCKTCSDGTRSGLSPRANAKSQSKGEVVPIPLHHFLTVTRPGLGVFHEYQSYNRDALLSLSEELGVPIQEIALRHKKLNYSDEEELTKEETPTAKRLFRISVLQEAA